jgi:hypothetical protein
MVNIEFKNWLKLSLLNLLIVGIIGVIMRYKIIYSLPLLDQKHLQHAHSHFAFAGWISQTLIIFMVWFLHKHHCIKNFKVYKFILLFNAIAAYGMLVCFTLFGYNAISIFFSTSSVLVSFIFCYYFYIDSKKVKQFVSVQWFNAALIFNIISSIGTFALAYIMVSKQLQQHTYLSSVYWYLHFQYNGWFFFACVGLLLSQIDIIKTDEKKIKFIFWLFFTSCFPAYMLSVLWINLPTMLYFLTTIAAFVQLFCWLKFIHLIKNYIQYIKIKTHQFISYILIILALAITLKFILQLGSTIPSVSKLAFGFRPIVIAYLHLVLLAIISVFLICFMHLKGLFTNSKNAVWYTVFIVIGIYLNELVLAIQGIASFDYILIPYAYEVLLFIAFGIVFSIFNLLYPIIKTKKNVNSIDTFN